MLKKTKTLLMYRAISSCNGIVLILGTARSYFKESFTVDSIQALAIYLWA